MSNRFVKDPREVVRAGQVVTVKVLSVDIRRKRISLTLRLDDPIGEDGPKKRQSGDNGRGRGRGRGDGRGRGGRGRGQRKEEPSGGTLGDLFKRRR
jgi:uncharacterized protein